VDPLALLCNLFAEGPSTLRVLHRAGIRTLTNVLATSDWALAEFLGGSPSAARRFLREAARLAVGSTGRLLDAEESEDSFRYA
jgi:hypothetical protein